MTEGTVVVVSTGQAGSLQWIVGDVASVLLANGDVWTGNSKQIREPQNEEELAAAPRDVERLEKKTKKRSPYEPI